MDIHNKEFKRSFRGYNEDEIDEFLDQVVNDYEKLYRENDNLKEELERNKRNIEQYQRLEKNLQDTLLVAQRTAEEVISTARANAAELKENTARECQNMRQEAELSAKRQIDEAANKVRDIVAEYDRLVREKDQFLKKLRVSMESELAILNHAINGFPNTDMEEKPEEMEQPKKQEVPSEDTVPMEKTSEPETDGEKKEE
ncbi:MAG: DivIVA domain-containing protein [Selenomonadaceae bacterium]|nr:DivIVA domain-containing protein [Selenomonadaceae bacterium]MBQ1914300.1 DivIVA domain-containing protein [Selenomonadaceae bacterium]